MANGLDREKFEGLVETAFEHLPAMFRNRLDNVRIVVDDEPSDEQVRAMRLRSKRELLGLYEGVPLENRDTGYGIRPTMPDRITLFRKNIEAECRTEESVAQKILEVLIHEIGHYFGMSEEEIRKAGY